MTYNKKFQEWLLSDTIDENTKNELRSIHNEKEIEDRFYKDLEFGTAGLRGIRGAGTNRMNAYTVAKSTEGLARYLKQIYKEKISVIIAYDSRHMSLEFAKVAALTLAQNGVEVKLFNKVTPTPELSFAVRMLKAKAGIVLTASHNPKEYNGYKVYDSNGCQITDKVANCIMLEIKKVKLDDIKKINISDINSNNLIEILDKNVDEKYIETVKDLGIRKELVKSNSSDLKIVYTPIHGTGLILVKEVLSRLGYDNIIIVKEQAEPNGDFPTVKLPNPEDPEVFNIAIDIAIKNNADIILGTDPDADRIGVMVKLKDNTYKALTGNEIGILLTNYIVSSLKSLKKLPDNGAVIKTIVTSKMIDIICKSYNVEVFDVLTGFKYIGTMINNFNDEMDKTYLFGFEESYGYLYGEHVRDKDAIVTAQLICEMALYYKKKGIDLYEELLRLYDKYGYYKEETISVELEGKKGKERINRLLKYLRKNPIKEIMGVKVLSELDYKESKETDLKTKEVREINLPKSDVIKYLLEDDSWVVIRESGTESKIKIYIGIIGDDMTSANKKIKTFNEDIIKIINNILYT